MIGPEDRRVRSALTDSPGLFIRAVFVFSSVFAAGIVLSIQKTDIYFSRIYIPESS